VRFNRSVNASSMQVQPTSFADNGVCLTRNNRACDYAFCAFPVSGSQQLRLLRTHPRVAKFQHNTTVIGGKILLRMLVVKDFRRSIAR